MKNALPLTFLAAVFASTSNFIYRKSRDGNNKETPNGYLLLFYFSSFIFTFLSSRELLLTPIHLTMFFLGGCVGFLNVLLMLTLSKAVEIGPSGLTFSFQNASSLFPGILLFISFGPTHGFEITFPQMAGIFIVLIGLFIGTKSETMTQSSYPTKWLKYSLICFFIQIAALTLIQARVAIFHCYFPMMNIESADLWFMPGQFTMALLLQFFLFLREKRTLSQYESYFGFLGGVANCISTFLLLMATKLALSYEAAILFPLFAVSTIILCNLWANKIFKEKFDLKTNFLCSAGIIISSL